MPRLRESGGFPRRPTGGNQPPFARRLAGEERLRQFGRLAGQANSINRTAGVSDLFRPGEQLTQTIRGIGQNQLLQDRTMRTGLALAGLRQQENDRDAEQARFGQQFDESKRRFALSRGDEASKGALARSDRLREMDMSQALAEKRLAQGESESNTRFGMQEMGLIQDQNQANTRTALEVKKQEEDTRQFDENQKRLQGVADASAKPAFKPTKISGVTGSTNILDKDRNVTGKTNTIRIGKQFLDALVRNDYNPNGEPVDDAAWADYLDQAQTVTQSNDPDTVAKAAIAISRGQDVTQTPDAGLPAQQQPQGASPAPAAPVTGAALRQPASAGVPLAPQQSQSMTPPPIGNLRQAAGMVAGGLRNVGGALVRGMVEDARTGPARAAVEAELRRPMPTPSEVPEPADSRYPGSQREALKNRPQTPPQEMETVKELVRDAFAMINSGDDQGLARGRMILDKLKGQFSQEEYDAIVEEIGGEPTRKPELGPERPKDPRFSGGYNLVRP